MAEKYSLGIDYGTLSARAVLFSVTDGRELAAASFPYPHGVMEKALPDGTPLPPAYALQCPQDYLDALHQLIPAVLRSSGVRSEDVISLGVDFTACTVLPVLEDGTPLCALPRFAAEPQAWVKLWKHHGAERYARRITETAQQLHEDWLLEMYGGRLSPEMLLCKLLEVYEEAPAVYQSADLYLEACDWITWMLTGKLCRSEAAAGICGCWRKQGGYPSPALLEALSDGFSGALTSVLQGEHRPIGSAAGTLREELARQWGLSPQTVVAVPLVDSQAAVPGAGISGEGKLLATMGTSTVYLLLGHRAVSVPGMGACSEDSILSGYYGYSAGQSCVGDHFAWAVEQIVPPQYHEQAAVQGLDIHAYLTLLAQRQRPGQHGLLALDWWNGNRCVLTDMDLTGTIVGLTLATRPEDIYRALIEATAYGARKIVEAFRSSGVPIRECYASGGIPRKNPLLMQIYADVLQMPIWVCGGSNGPALGAAVLAATAAGSALGGYDRQEDAAAAMGRVTDICYTPTSEGAAVYDALYREYSVLHDYFGRGENDVMKRLRELQRAAVCAPDGETQS